MKVCIPTNMNMTTTRIYEDTDCIYRCVLLLLMEMSTNCMHKLKVPNFCLADVHFFTDIGNFKLSSNIHKSTTQNNGILLYTDLLIHGSKRACKTTAFKFQTTLQQKQLTHFIINTSKVIVFKCSVTLMYACGSYITLSLCPLLSQISYTRTFTHTCLAYC
jgi:hypothetical protein